ncbi:hypothetical protein EJB05_41137, partial [Eragrostis curvula]
MGSMVIMALPSSGFRGHAGRPREPRRRAGREGCCFYGNLEDGVGGGLVVRAAGIGCSPVMVPRSPRPRRRGSPADEGVAGRPAVRASLLLPMQVIPWLLASVGSELLKRQLFLTGEEK